MSEHTATPWVNIPQTNGSSMICREYETGDQMNPKGLRLIANVLARLGSLREDEANTEFIVRAVNSHDDLVKAVERWLSWCDDWHAGKSHPSDDLEFARAALSRARGNAA